MKKSQKKTFQVFFYVWAFCFFGLGFLVPTLSLTHACCIGWPWHCWTCIETCPLPAKFSNPSPCSLVTSPRTIWARRWGRCWRRLQLRYTNCRSRRVQLWDRPNLQRLVIISVFRFKKNWILMAYLLDWFRLFWKNYHKNRL